MAEFSRGNVDMEYFEQGIRLADFDGGRLDLAFWLAPDFRVNHATIHHAQDCGGVTIAAGDGITPDRFGAAVALAAGAVQELTPAGPQVVGLRMRPVLTANNVSTDAAHKGQFTVRVYGYSLA